MIWVSSLDPWWPPNNIDSENATSGCVLVGLVSGVPRFAGDSLRVFDGEGGRICVAAPRLRGEVGLTDSIEDMEEVRERFEKRELELEVEAKED